MAPDSQPSQSISAEEARAAIIAGQVVSIVVGDDPGDPTCLLYVDRVFEFDGEPMVFTESIAGWSYGVKEAVCEPENGFLLEFIAEPAPLSITITASEPPQRGIYG